MRIQIILIPLLFAAFQAHAQSNMPDDAAQGTCIIKPHSQIQLGSAVSGILSATLVDRGDSVKKGQVVARSNRAWNRQPWRWTGSEPPTTAP